MTKIIVNGSFDILHLGHLRLLEYAKSWPNSYVYVLIDSDRRIRELKGPTRPVHSEHERASFLAALKSVDRVDIFDSDEELETMIKNYAPDVMVKGSDYKGKPIIGEQFCGEVRFHDRLEKYSTTNTIKKIQDSINR